MFIQALTLTVRVVLKKIWKTKKTIIGCERSADVCVHKGESCVFGGQSSTVQAKYLQRWRKRWTQDHLWYGVWHKKSSSVLSVLSHAHLCPPGWLISSHRCLRSRRRSFLTLLRGSWLQERESWLQMSQQVRLLSCLGSVLGGEGGSCRWSDPPSSLQEPWGSACRRSTWRTTRRTAAPSATSSSPPVTAWPTAWAGWSSSTRRSTRSRTVASSSPSSSRTRALLLASRWGASEGRWLLVFTGGPWTQRWLCWFVFRWTKAQLVSMEQMARPPHKVPFFFFFF